MGNEIAAPKSAEKTPVYQRNKSFYETNRRASLRMTLPMRLFELKMLSHTNCIRRVFFDIPRPPIVQAFPALDQLTCIISF